MEEKYDVARPFRSPSKMASFHDVEIELWCENSNSCWGIRVVLISEKDGKLAVAKKSRKKFSAEVNRRVTSRGRAT